MLDALSPVSETQTREKEEDGETELGSPGWKLAFGSRDRQGLPEPSLKRPDHACPAPKMNAVLGSQQVPKMCEIQTLGKSSRSKDFPGRFWGGKIPLTGCDPMGSLPLSAQTK